MPPSMPGFLFGSVVNICSDLGYFYSPALPVILFCQPHLAFPSAVSPFLVSYARSKIVVYLLKYLDVVSTSVMSHENLNDHTSV